MKDGLLNNRKIILALALVLVLFTGCRLNRPSDVLSPKVMEKFLYDYHLSQGIIAGLPQDQKYKAQALTDWAMTKNGISNEQFERSLVWYTRYPGEFAKIYKKLNRRIDAEYKEAQNMMARIEKRSFSVGSGDSVSLWYLDSVTILNSSSYMSRLTMEQLGASSFKPYDTIVWNGNATVLGRDTLAGTALYLAMSLVYTDSISTLDTLLYGPVSSHISFTLVLDSIKNMESVKFLAQFLEDSDSKSRGTAVLSGVDMIRYHNRTDTATVMPDSGEVLKEEADSLKDGQ